jgi:tRNA dimethylallyltransferase
MVEVPENPRLRAELEPLPEAALLARLRQSRPRQHNTTDVTDRSRLFRAIEIAEGATAPEADRPLMPKLRPRVFGLRWERAELRRRIAARLRDRLAQGLIEEVERLHAAGHSWERLEYFGLEYRYVAWHLQGKLNRNDLMQKLASAIGELAKRQETWFRRMERQGVEIHWLEGGGEPLLDLLAALDRLS